MANKKPRVMIWDLENSHIIARCWGLWKQNINTSDIIHDWFILCGAYKFLGEKKVYKISCTRKELLARDDKRVVKEIAKVVESADILIAHNGDSFDMKKLKARIFHHNLPPVSHKKSIDTLKVIRKEFKITSNKLDYACKYVNLSGKLTNEAGLWNRVEDGSMKDMKKMVAYNVQDVLGLEEFYLRLRPHISNHPNLSVISGNTDFDPCPACDSCNSIKYGFVYKIKTKFQKYKCKDCGNSYCGGRKLC